MYSPIHPFFKLNPGVTVKSNKSMSCRTWLRLSVAKFSSHLGLIQFPLTGESNKVPVSPGQCQVRDNDFIRIKWLLSYYTSSITWTRYLSKNQPFLLLDFAGEKRNGIENTVSESLKLKLLMEFNPILSSEVVMVAHCGCCALQWVPCSSMVHQWEHQISSPCENMVPQKQSSPPWLASRLTVLEVENPTFFLVLDCLPISEYYDGSDGFPVQLKMRQE